MTVPTPVPFSSVPLGGVFSSDLVNYFMKCDATTQVNLSSGAVSTGINPTTGVTFFSGASLVLT
jgi:hypothetical protein